MILSRYLHDADYKELASELGIVDRYFTQEREQHPARRWEYALSLRALEMWEAATQPAHVVYDIGGGGSPFKHMVGPCTVVDPNLPADSPDHHRQSLAQFVTDAPMLADAVFCLSVLEHVDDLYQFVYHLSCLVRPGGLLVLTMDACDCRHAVDPHHFRWMRQRIFTRELYLDLKRIVANLQFQPFLGGVVSTYPGPAVYDYSFRSLVLVKNP
jgi:SAM-dependent methyltransferase